MASITVCDICDARIPNNKITMVRFYSPEAHGTQGNKDICPKCWSYIEQFINQLKNSQKLHGL